MYATCIYGLATLLLLMGAAHAADRIEGLEYVHEDWELACDNTRTCRAAGYQADDGGDMPVSVLLTRKAGAATVVAGQVMLGNYDDDSTSKTRRLPQTFPLLLHINGRSVGQASMQASSMVADLAPDLVKALLAALPRKSRIVFSAQGLEWVLSDAGAAAVLLKMDEFQGRIGTRGALLKKGALAEDGVLHAVPEPTFRSTPPVPTRAGDAALVETHRATLLAELRQPLDADDKLSGKEYCPDLRETAENPVELQVERLTETQLLVSTRCWLAAYQAGDGYWIIRDRPPFKPRLVTTVGTDTSPGEIHSALKGRGLGDCWSSRTWTWDGKDFVLTQASTTGMCRLLAPGGAWDLPTLVTATSRPDKP